MLFTIYYFTIYYLLFTIYYLLFTIYYLLFTIYYLLSTIYYLSSPGGGPLAVLGAAVLAVGLHRDVQHRVPRPRLLPHRAHHVSALAGARVPVSALAGEGVHVPRVVAGELVPSCHHGYVGVLGAAEEIVSITQ